MRNNFILYCLCFILNSLALAQISTLYTTCFKTSSSKYGSLEGGFQYSDLPLLKSGLVSSSHRVSRIFACSNVETGFIQAVQLTLFSNPNSMSVSLNQFGHTESTSCEILDLNVTASEYVTSFGITYNSEEVTGLNFTTSSGNLMVSGQTSGRDDE